MRNIITALALLWICQTSEASADIGGHVVVCKKGSIESAHLLEYYLAEKNSTPIDLGSSTSTKDQYLREALRRVRQFSPLRAEHYQKLISSLQERWEIVPKLYVGAGEKVSVPNLDQGCVIRQIVIQKEIETSVSHFENRYFVDQRYWRQLSIRDQAGLILHSLLLKERFDYVYPTSEDVRKLNTLISTSSFKKLKTTRDWAHYLYNKGFLATDMCGFWYPLDEYLFESKYDYAWHSSGHLKDFLVPGNMSFRWPDDIFSRQVPQYMTPVFRTGYGVLDSFNWIKCGENGKVTTMNLASPVSGELKFANARLKSAGLFNIHFFDNGKIRELSSETRFGNGVLSGFLGKEFKEVSKVRLSKVSDRVIGIVIDKAYKFSHSHGEEIEAKGVIDWYETGEIKRVELASSHQLTDVNGVKRMYPARARITFFKDGRVLHAFIEP